MRNIAHFFVIRSWSPWGYVRCPGRAPTHNLVSTWPRQKSSPARHSCRGLSFLVRIDVASSLEVVQ
jgi:hypothetical protein